MEIDLLFLLGLLRVAMYLTALRFAVRLRSLPVAFVCMVLAINASITAGGGSRAVITIFSMFSAPVLCLVLMRFARYEAHRRVFEAQARDRLLEQPAPSA